MWLLVDWQAENDALPAIEAEPLVREAAVSKLDDYGY
jgi:hypothetical protein